MTSLGGPQAKRAFTDNWRSPCADSHASRISPASRARTSDAKKSGSLGVLGVLAGSVELVKRASGTTSAWPGADPAAPLSAAGSATAPAASERCSFSLRSRGAEGGFGHDRRSRAGISANSDGQQRRRSGCQVTGHPPGRTRHHPRPRAEALPRGAHNRAGCPAGLRPDTRKRRQPLSAQHRSLLRECRG